MSKIRNLFAGFICLVLALVCLASCITVSPKEAAKTQAESDAQDVLNKLVWDEEDRTAIVSSLTFATSNKNYPGVTISWTSSEEDLISTTGKVNRPNSDDERNVLVGEDLLATVIITATVVAEYTWEENGTQTATTEPIAKQFEFTVLAKPEGTDVGTIEDVKLRAWNYIYVEQGVDKALVSNNTITYNVMLSGVITAKLNADGATKGFMLHDGTDGIYVYGDNTKFNVGDSVEVIGGIYSYYGSLQVGSNVSVSKSSEKFTVPAYKEVTPQAWEDQNKGLGDDVIGHLGGDLYKVEGYLTASYNATTKDEFCITDANTGEVSWIYYKSYNADMKAELEKFVGKYVKVTGTGYDRDSRIVKNHLLWDGGIEEAAAPVVDDETKANVLLSQITLKDSYDADFDLNANGVWEVVSGTGVEIVEGVAKVTRADADQVVVLKVTVTVGEAVVSKELTVTIKAIVKETPKHAGTKEDPYTVSDALLVAGGLENQALTETVYAVGTIVSIKEVSAQYGNGTFNISDGKQEIIVYRAKYLNNEKFTSEDQIKVGDVVLICGQLTNYNGTLEFNSGCYIDSFFGEDTPVKPEPPVVEPTEGLKAGQAYKLQLVQPKAGKTVYFTGAMNGYYYATSEDINAGVDVYAEVVEGGYNLYFLDAQGVKHYMGVVVSGTHVNAVFDQEKTVYSYDAELKTVFVTIEGEKYLLGTRNDNTYLTIGANKASYDPFYVTFVVAGEPSEHEHNFVDGECSCGEKDPNYQPPAAGEYTVAEALKLADNANVVVKGTVDSVEAWNDQYQNMSFTLKDSTGELYVYRCSTKVALGDIVTLTGVMATYYENRQIAQGSTCVITGHDDSYDKETEGAKITFDNVSKRTTFTTELQVWEENGIKVTNNKSASTSAVADYAAPARFYKSSQLIIEAEKAFTKITFKTNSKNFSADFTVEGAKVTVSGTTCVIEFTEAVTSFEIAELPYQVRVDYLILE